MHENDQRNYRKTGTFSGMIRKKSDEISKFHIRDTGELQ